MGGVLFILLSYFLLLQVLMKEVVSIGRNWKEKVYEGGSLQSKFYYFSSYHKHHPNNSTTTTTHNNNIIQIPRMSEESCCKHGGSCHRWVWRVHAKWRRGHPRILQVCSLRVPPQFPQKRTSSRSSTRVTTTTTCSQQKQ